MGLASSAISITTCKHSPPDTMGPDCKRNDRHLHKETEGNRWRAITMADIHQAKLAAELKWGNQMGQILEVARLKKRTLSPISTTLP
jgi:hypothetical protein